jgi:hypothetical protein
MKECSVGEVTYESELYKYYKLMEMLPSVEIGACIEDFEMLFFEAYFGF